MELFDTTDLENWTSGSWKNGLPEAVGGFSNDTRSINMNDMFVALKTERRDGHDYLDEAKANGASAAIVSEFRSENSLPQLVVEDSLVGFQSIARAHRSLFIGKVIGITGSCGKTTCKELIALLLGAGEEVLATKGNLNNFLGVPLTLTRLSLSTHRFAVVEAGISEPSEMAVLASMIEPDIAVFTSIGAAHLKELGSMENVALEKSKLTVANRTSRAYLDVTSSEYRSYFAIAPNVVARNTPELSAIGDYTVDRKGMSHSIRIRLRSGIETFTFQGAQSSLASNVALAILVVSDLGVSVNEIRVRLTCWQAAPMRGEWIEYSGKHVYLDCYNANPLSMLDSIDSFENVSTGSVPRLYILGSMEELGDSAVDWHEKIGNRLNVSEADRVFVLGGHADDFLRGMNKEARLRGEHIDSMDKLQEIVNCFEGDVFVKGSRQYRLESLFESIRDQTNGKERGSC